MSDVRHRYLSSDYSEKNPTWDMEDSPWKAKQVAKVLESGHLVPTTICEIGCGSGKVLESLAAIYPNTSFRGFDIAPAAKTFWQGITHPRVSFTLGDFAEVDQNHYDLVLLLDVVEHVSNPHEFLLKIRDRGDYFGFHLPLDLSAASVLREAPLLHVRRKVGHVHYFTKGLALELLDESGYQVVESHYTGAAFNSPQSSPKTYLAQLPRRIAYALNKDFGVRLLGGETLMVLAKPK